MPRHLKKEDEKNYIWLRVIASLLVVACAGYSATRYEDYFGGEGGTTHLVIAALLVAAMLVLVWWRNRLSDRANLICSAISWCITPFMCYALVECANSEWSCLFVEDAGLSIKLHMLNGMIYVFILLFFLGLTASLRISSIVSYAFFGLLGAAQYYVCMFRGQGFVASDFVSIKAAMNVAGSYDFNPNYWMFVAILMTMFGIILSSRFRGGLVRGIKKRAAFVAGAIVVAGAFVGTYFFLPQTKDMKVKLYKPQETYMKKGSMLAFVRSFRYLVIDKPEGYSVEAVEEIVARYSDDAEAAKISCDETPNLILIMNESLCDVNDISEGAITTNIDNLPVIHNLDENTVKGTLYEERRGGGTAIMEFETLTGVTNAFFPIGTIAYQTVLKGDTAALPSQLAANGYQGIIASHPHYPDGYNRQNAYPMLGFKQFVSKDDFKASGHDKKYGRYISDEAAYDELIEEFETATASSDDPFFAFQVTMQNHAPYDSAETDDVKITSEDTYDEFVEQYMNYAYTSDKQIGRLIEYFEDVDDPTLVVVFGDHAPRFDTSYYQKLLGITTSLTDEQEMSFQRTPIIMWANYDIEEEDLGDTSDNYTAAKIIELLGLKQTGYQRFLQDLQEDIPVINSLGYRDKDGNYYEIDDKTSPYYEKVREYNMLIYNELVDTEHTVEGFFE